MSILRVLHRLLVALQAPDHRRRWGARSRRAFDAWVGEADDGREARRRAWRAVIDAAVTMGTTWLDVTRSGVRHGRTGMKTVWDTCIGALVYTGREMRRRPLHAAVVVGTLGIAIGANAALFSATELLLVRELPYSDPDRIVRVAGAGVNHLYGEAFRVDEEFASLPGIASTAFYTPGGAATLTASRNRRVRVSFVSPEFFDVAGVSLALGPGLEDIDIGVPAAVLAYGVWQQDFGGDPEVLDRDVVLNGQAYRIVGVAPPEVSWPDDSEVWVGYPVRWEFMGSAFGAETVARLEPGADRETVQRALQVLKEPERAEWIAQGYDLPTAGLVPIREELVGDTRGPILILFGASGIVLLLGALNLTSVWIHRVLERGAELRTRRALGASRLRLVAQLTAEATALSVIGGLAALAVASLGTRLLAARIPAVIPGAAELAVSPRTVGFAATLALLLGVAIGGVAALRGSSAGLAGSRDGRTRARARTELALLLGQAALASVLIVGSLMAVRSLQHLVETPLGFEPDATLAFSVQIPESEASTQDEIARYVESVALELGAIPGVEMVGWTSRLPLSTGTASGNSLRREGASPTESVSARRIQVSRDYFTAAGVEVVAGRGPGPDWDEREVIIDTELADTLFAGGSTAAVGATIERLTLPGGQEEWVPVRVRGVVEAQRTSGPRNRARASFYAPIETLYGPQIGFLTRVRGNPSDLRARVEAAVLSVNEAIVPDRIRSLRATADELLATDRTLAAVISGFSLAGLLLAALGLYGVTGRQVSSRRRELGVRLALGAEPTRLVAKLTLRGALLGAVAVLFAVPGVVLGGGLLAERLFEVPAVDPALLAIAAITVVTVTTVAAWVPARRVRGISPRDALQAE